MKLDRKNLLFRKLKSGQSPVKEGDMCRDRIFRQAVSIDDKSMVLTGNQNRVRLLVINRMVGAMVTEMHFGNLAAKRERQQLVSKANSENRQFIPGQAPDGRNRVRRNRDRISGAV